jgi:hypothetical protein
LYIGHALPPSQTAYNKITRKDIHVICVLPLLHINLDVGG